MPKKIFFLATILLVVFFIPKIVSANVVINEIMYDLEEGSDTGREWVEIFNNSEGPFDLTDWRFFEGGVNHKLTLNQGNVILSPDEYAIIADNSDKFLIDNPDYSGTLFDSAFSFKNDGESIVLKDNNLTVIDEVTYSSSWGAGGNGRSLQRKDANKNSNDPTNWGTGNPTPGTINNISEESDENGKEETTDESKAPSTTTGNNPPIPDAGDNIIAFIGQEINFDGANSSDPDDDELAYSWNMGDGKLIEELSFTYKYSYPGTYLVTLMVYDGQYYASETITVKIQSQEITINEFIPNPEGADEENEWIEIYNNSNSIVDISGWQLDDEASGSQPFVFPENTLIAPKNYLVFARPITKIALNNDEDCVRLLLPGGVVFQEVQYEKPKEGQSSANTAEGFVWSVPTPGMANIMGLETNMRIGGEEIVYNYQIEPQLTKEPVEDYSWYFEKPEQEIEGGFIEKEPSSYAEATEEKESDLAGAFPLTEENGVKGVQTNNQSTINLILIIVAIVLAAFAIGFSLVKFRKKFP